MGWDIPVFAHVPLIHGADGAKLSKRHGAQGVEDYRAMGYLPAALRNYLARLGWSHGDDEIIPTPQLIEWFDIADINKSASRFDFKKLDDLNGHYIRSTPEPELLTRIKDMLPHLDFAALLDMPLDPKAPARADVALAKAVTAQLDGIKDGRTLLARFETAGFEKLGAALPSLRERARTLCEMVEGALYLAAERPLKPDDKAKALLDAEAKKTIAALVARFSKLKDWTAAALEDDVRQFAEETGLKLGKVAQPLRAALTGRSVSPPVFDVMAVLGREESLARLMDQAG